MNSVFDTIKSDPFIKGVAAKIEEIKHMRTVSPIRYKRSAYDRLNETGLLDHVGEFIGEFALIIMQKSELPKSQREFILLICLPIYNNLIKQNHETN